ncbi:MAG: hypothetical protein NT007_08505 [Candidatus Kapabacteria bacterium]|nr:hypothetical protein [Candidatus Kapabacteria bacterium]
MSILTVYVIPSSIEPIFWLIIFIVSAYIIAKTCKQKLFLHGFLTSLANCVWITCAHILLFNDYIAHHSNEAEMMANMSTNINPKLMMLITGPIIGIISGLILGFFATLSGKLLKKRA